MRKLLEVVCACVVASASAGCAHGQGTGGRGLTPQAGRITDDAIFADYRTFDRVEQRLRAVNVSGVPLTNYRLARALALLDFAFDEYHENNRSRIVERAVGEAQRLADDLEANRPASPTRGSIEDTEPVRPDLWQLAETLKAHPNFTCGGGAVARLEVMLMHADHERRGGGWRRARPQVEVAESLAQEARRTIETCTAP